MDENKKSLETLENATGSTDQELSELLDSALEDFSKQSDDKTLAEEKAKDANKQNEDTGESDIQWTEDFLKQFESNIANLLGPTPDGENPDQAEQIRTGFKRMAEAAQQALSNPGVDNPVSADIASTITQTIQGLSEGSENLQMPFTENDVANMFGNLGSEQNAFLPFMQGMMQCLLSKDVLYPSLKDIIDKFPGWLAENDSKLSQEDKDRYTKQQEIITQVCKELEDDSENDPPDVKKKRFDKVLNLMQVLQEYGQPPVDIVGDMSGGLNFDPQGNPDQCCIM